VPVLEKAPSLLSDGSPFVGQIGTAPESPLH
jgi:hypothetical protein